MLILGISCFYHDAGAAILRDGQVVAAAEEERFTRCKHDSGFPSNAIEYCLREAGARIQDVDHIGFYEKPLVKFNRILETVLAEWPWSLTVWLRSMSLWLGERLHIARTFQRALGTDKPLLYCRHHLSHAASAFYPSPFEEAAILTADGVGEWTTTAWGVGRGTAIDIQRELRFPHSLGLLFSALTAYLGFRVNDAEWKVMGLAPYGRPRYLDRFRQLVDVRDDGSFRLDLRYFSYTRSMSRMFSRRWERLFGRPARPRGTEPDEFHADIACSGQKLIEEIMLKIAGHIRRETGLDRLCLAGGVGLNCVANWRILQESGFHDVFIQPAAGDSGGALGTALYIRHAVLGHSREWRMRHALLGPAFSQQEIEAALQSVGARFRRCDTEEALVAETARLLAEGKVIGWFQGRMEYGPRALGARSLLADPRRPDMKDLINAKVKFRERFRPFAPAVLQERAHEYFDLPTAADAPFMLLTPQARETHRSEIPAVVHVDGSCRVQTVDREVHPLFHRLIKAFGELTGVPVLVNTSFNVRGEPIVCTPLDAWNTFVSTGIDALVIGRCLVLEKPVKVDFEAGTRRSIALEAGELTADA